MRSQGARLLLVGLVGGVGESRLAVVQGTPAFLLEKREREGEEVFVGWVMVSQKKRMRRGWNRVLILEKRGTIAAQSKGV